MITAAPFPAIPWHAGPVMNSDGSTTFTPAPLTGAWVTPTGVPTNSFMEETSGTVKTLQQQAQQQAPTYDVPTNNFMEERSGNEKTLQHQQQQTPTYDGNYLKRWPPPPGTSPGLITTLGVRPGVTPAVPPPAPPPIGMAPPPPPASHIMDTPDVLPQPTPPVMATDARWGTKQFPTQNDAGETAVPGTEARTSQDPMSEPLQNEPLMTPFSRDNTMQGGSS